MLKKLKHQEHSNICYDKILLKAQLCHDSTSKFKNRFSQIIDWVNSECKGEFKSSEFEKSLTEFDFTNAIVDLVFDDWCISHCTREQIGQIFYEALRQIDKVQSFVQTTKKYFFKNVELYFIDQVW
jgi:hypothetical protein